MAGRIARLRQLKCSHFDATYVLTVDFMEIWLLGHGLSSVKNAWDRMPFLTDVLYSEEANNYNRNISSNNANDNNDKVLFSFDSLMNKIKHNLIIANYGASWAVDNDDGSSFYDIFDNVFLDSNGFKVRLSCF